MFWVDKNICKMWNLITSVASDLWICYIFAQKFELSKQKKSIVSKVKKNRPIRVKYMLMSQP